MKRSELAAGYRRVRDFSWPRRFPLAQFPNDALIVAFVAGELAAMLPHAMRIRSDTTITSGTIEVDQLPQAEFARIAVDAPLSAARAVMNLNRACWKLFSKMYDTGRAA